MGKVTVVGGKVGMEAPSPPVILASELAVGSTVKVLENGSPVEYLVVSQGRPSGSSLYDSSCNGTWLLRKDRYTRSQWSSSSNTLVYSQSTIHTDLNSTFINRFDSATKAKIKTVKIPYVTNSDYGRVDSGASGLSTQVFILSAVEVGFITSIQVTALPKDGAVLSYFTQTNDANSKRAISSNWWTRTVQPESTNIVLVGSSGEFSVDGPTYSQGVRPAFVLQSTAEFDQNTLILKGVS